MSMAASEATSGVTYGNEGKSTPWLVVGLIVAALIVAWAVMKKG